jgi:hypothetical protein
MKRAIVIKGTSVMDECDGLDERDEEIETPGYRWVRFNSVGLL